MRYRITIKQNPPSTFTSQTISILYEVNRDKSTGFQTHRENGPAHRIIYYMDEYQWDNVYYYLRGHQYRSRRTWSNALKYKKYSSKYKGLI